MALLAAIWTWEGRTFYNRPSGEAVQWHWTSTKKSDQRRLERANSNRAVVTADTKAEAVQKVREYMKTHEGSVNIHRRDGEFKKNGRTQEARTRRSGRASCYPTQLRRVARLAQ